MGFGPISYIKFALAREYVDVSKTEPAIYPYKRNVVDWIGHGLRFPIGTPLGFALQQIKNPIVIVALTAIAALTISLVFYPEKVLSLVPFLKWIQPWMVKGTIFVLLQMTILGLGVRTAGRLSNKDLMEKWNAGDLKPLLPGFTTIKIDGKSVRPRTPAKF